MKKIISPLNLSLAVLLFGAAIGNAQVNNTWTGSANASWSTAGNWSPGPLNPGDSLIFDGANQTSPNNDFPVDTGFGGIRFAPLASAFTLTGNEIWFAGLIENDTTNTLQTLALPLVLTNATTVNTTTDIVTATSADLEIVGAISGTGALTKNGGGTLTLDNKSYSGGTIVNSGLLVVSNDNGGYTMSGGALMLNFRTYFTGVGISFTADSAVGIDLLDNTEPRGVDIYSTIGTPGFKFTKIGQGIIRMAGGGITSSSIDVAAGTLANLGGSSLPTTHWGTNLITVENGATLRADDGGVCPNPIILNGGDGTSAGNYTHQGVLVSGSRNNAGNPTNNIFSNTITLAADSTIGSQYGNLILAGNLNGPGGLTKIGSNPLILSGTNSYSGTTIVNLGILQVGSSGALPGGTTNGDIYLAGTSKLDLNGFNSKINGLNDDGGGTAILDNTSVNPATLTFGGNNTTPTWVGLVQNSGNSLSLVKIGSGTASLLGVNTYNGSNVVTGGKLEINIPIGTTSNGVVVVADGTELSLHKTLSGSALKPAGVTLGTSGATILDLDLGNFGNPSLAILNSTNGTGILSANGSVTINIACNPNVMSVGQFPLIKYTTRTGNGSFILGSLPSPLLATIVTNTVNKSIDLKITSAPITTWVGSVTNNNWDIGTTTNWQVLGVGSLYQDGVGVLFSDPAATNYVNITTTVSPSATLVNSTNNYTFDGPGGIAANDLTKNGSGTLILLTTNNTYNNTFVSGGTLQVGNGGTNGLLGVGNVQIDATLAINHADTFTLPNTVSGVGSLVKQNTNTLIISAANTYAGSTTINQGVVQLGNNAALGTPATGVPLATIASGASLNVAGKMTSVTNLVIASGTGVASNQGAIFSTVGQGCDIGCTKVGIISLQLAGNTAIGNDGASWSIGNSLNTSALGNISGNGFSLTKVGNNTLILSSVGRTAPSQFVIAGGGVVFTAPNPIGGTVVISNNAWLDTFDNVNNAGFTITNNFIIGAGGGQLRNTRGAFFGVADVNTYPGSVTLNDTLTILNTSSWSGGPGNFLTLGKMTFTGPIAGSGGIVNNGAVNTVTLNGANTYAGRTVVNAGILQLSAIQQGGGTYTNNDGGVLDLPGQVGFATVPMSIFALGSTNGATLSLSRLTAVSTSIAPITATNLVLAGTNSVVVPGIAFANAGQYPLIKYTTIVGDITNLVLGASGVRGVPGSLSNNVANGSIDLVVPGGSPVSWVGNVSTNWDIASTANWLYQATPTTYQQNGSLGDAVTFDDTTTKTNVYLTTPVSPTFAIVNTTNTYAFFGTNLTGGTSLVKSGSGTLVLSNFNNNLTGGSFVNAGTLRMGNWGANNLSGSVTVAAGGTFDLGSNNPSAMIITAVGAGVGGNGAIQANYTGGAVGQGPSVVNMNGNLTIGGNNRWDLRNGSKQFNVSSNGAVLTKVGAGYIGLNGVTVSTNLGDVYILGGTLSYQAASTGLGNTNNTIYVGNGANLGFNSASIPLTKSIVCSNGAGILIDGGNALGLNVVAGPLNLLSGTTTIKGNFFNGIYFSNNISGPGALSLQFQSFVYLAGSNTFTGQLLVPDCNAASGGLGTRLSFIGNGSATKSSQIYMQGIAAGQAYAGYIDVSGRVDGTLTLATNQTLRGDNGAFVRGNVVASPGSTISPGGTANVQYMSCSNNLTLQAGSTVQMDVSASPLTNDTIFVSTNLTYGGTLAISRTGATLLSAGQTFKLFNATAYSGSFATIATNVNGQFVTWNTSQLAVNGTITVTSVTASTIPTLTNSVSGGALSLNWAVDHLGWTLQTNSVGLNVPGAWFPYPGSTAVTGVTIPISPTQTNVFYRLSYP